MSWILNLAYLLLLVVVSPVIGYRMLIHGKYRDGWMQKLLGRLPRRGSTRPCLWFHAVSVGEVLQLRTIITELQPRLSRHDIVITTTTVTGFSVAREKFPGPRYQVCYFPLDFSWAVRRALQRIRPSAVVLVELELWPNFILTAQQMGVPLGLINGRISSNSYRGYCRIRPLMKQLLGCFSALAVQNETYRRHLVDLGAPADRVSVTGSIKFDGLETDRHNPKTDEIRRSFAIGDRQRVLIAGSTQPPEEEYALDTWLELQREFPDLRLILVPRHKERFEEVAALVQSRGLSLIRRSSIRDRSVCESQAESVRSEVRRPGLNHPQHTIGHVQAESRCSPPPSSPLHPPSSPPPVLLLDTLGELSACWGLADVAFVGGSLTNRGGQNMIEPAAFGAAVLFGPNTWNFRDVVELLLSENAARVVHNREQLTQTVHALLADPDAAARQGRIAQQLVLSQQGATKKTVELVLGLLREIESRSAATNSWAA